MVALAIKGIEAFDGAETAVGVTGGDQIVGMGLVQGGSLGLDMQVSEGRSSSSSCNYTPVDMDRTVHPHLGLCKPSAQAAVAADAMHPTFIPLKTRPL